MCQYDGFLLSAVPRRADSGAWWHSLSTSPMQVCVVFSPYLLLWVSYVDYVPSEHKRSWFESRATLSMFWVWLHFSCLGIVWGGATGLFTFVRWHTVTCVQYVSCCFFCLFAFLTLSPPKAPVFFLLGPAIAEQPKWNTTHETSNRVVCDVNQALRRWRGKSASLPAVFSWLNLESLPNRYSALYPTSKVLNAIPLTLCIGVLYTKTIFCLSAL